MSARLIPKAEECKKDKRARDQQPAVHLETDSTLSVILPNDAWNLKNLGIVVVYGGPASPRSNTPIASGTVHENECSQRNGPKYLEEGQGHQAEVPATTEALRAHCLPELLLALVEQVDGRDWN